MWNYVELCAKLCGIMWNYVFELNEIRNIKCILYNKWFHILVFGAVMKLL